MFEIREFLQKNKQYSRVTQCLSRETWTHFSPAPKRKPYILELYIPPDLLKQTNKINLKAPPYITASWCIDFWMHEVEISSQSYWKLMSTEGQIPVWVFPPNCTQLPLSRFFYCQSSASAILFPKIYLLVFSRLESHLNFLSDILFH